MNLHKVKSILDFYKKHFERISREESYKWQAVKRFQDNWDIDRADFAEMLEGALDSTQNLLVSGNYFPRQMLLLNAKKEPETVRNLFVELFDEEKDWLNRITGFQQKFASINKRHFAGKADYQDPRAILVYLSLRFPNRYFFYKYGMFQAFVGKVDYPYKPVKGRIENLAVYHNLCQLLREEIGKDDELLGMHQQRLNDQHYLDKSFNILTQDVIYAAVRHFDQFEKLPEQKPALKRLIEEKRLLNPRPHKITLKGSLINRSENDREKKRLGDLGELLVLEYEQEKLLKLGSKKQPEHIAKTKC